MNDPNIHKCIIAVPEKGDAILVSSDPSLVDKDLFDGNFLADNVTDADTIPKEHGVYRCTIKCKYSKEYDSWSGGYEYDAEVWIEDAIKIEIPPK